MRGAVVSLLCGRDCINLRPQGNAGRQPGHQTVCGVNIKSVSQLRALLLEMETTLGLVELSPNERDVLYAINEVSAGVLRAARSDAIRAHPLAAAIPQATYHRALKSLVQRGLVQHAPDTKAGAYVVTRNMGGAGSG